MNQDHSVYSDPYWTHISLDDNCNTLSYSQQKQTELQVQQLLAYWDRQHADLPCRPLFTDSHINYLLSGLRGLSEQYQSLDASRPWICYWILHSLSLLGALERVDQYLSDRVVLFLSRCASAKGGYGGGPGQIPHLATTYAAICALVTLGTPHAYLSIDRNSIYDFLLQCKDKCGGFKMHADGEIDVRGTYTAVVVATLLNILTPDLANGTAEWVASCQTYEGGMGGEPGNEAHGGYTFCGTATLVLLKRTDLLNVHALFKWLVSRQMRLEGGFQGRTNKLVDSCYSFWVAGVFPLVHASLQQHNSQLDPLPYWLFHSEALTRYVSICCQNLMGGLYDKPGKHADYYHTCYSLSGLSISQHHPSGPVHGLNLMSTNPVFNIIDAKVEQVMLYYKDKDTI